jgi:asparagine synthase (glutamine-hydrolysing)
VSGIAGIIRFDGGPVEPGQVEKMTATLAHRGSDGVHHWASGNVALGHCMLRTTPESLEETQPLANEDQSLVLVMDGRVDNWEELRAELLKRGAVLRTRADAELVLRAYEAWGEDCPDRIIGEYAFFLWDSRQRRLFAARDAAGTRHFYYHAGRGWFAFASEIKGLLALEGVEPRLNESRVLDYLVPRFDRDDEVGTFYQGIERMPAGHAMTVSGRGLKTWRYWNPGDLPESRFASLDECAEAFLEQMRIAVKCRLRSIAPVGAMLSGGLDSSSIVGLIRKEFRDELPQPLRTFSLIREDRENCKDWAHIRPMLKDGWIDPTIMSSAIVDDAYQSYLDSIRNTDEPFALSHGLTYFVTYHAARQKDCSVVLDGIAGDLLFYGPAPSLNAALHSGRYSKIPAVLAAHRRHAIEGGIKSLARIALAHAAPDRFKSRYRTLRDKITPPRAEIKHLKRDMALRLLETKRALKAEAAGNPKPGTDQAVHAQHFTSGLLSFAHEVYGQIAFSAGVEPRSPLSDRRMLEFAIQMPLDAKLTASWYKQLLRKSMAGVLPEDVRWRSDLGNHPGWQFYERLISRIRQDSPTIWNDPHSGNTIGKWLNVPGLDREMESYARDSEYESGYRLLSIAILNQWLATRPVLY